MYQTITNVQLQDAIHLQQYIDNRCGNKCIGLRSVTYWVGWYNIQKIEYYRVRPNNVITTRTIQPGLYNFDDIKQIFEENGLSLSVNKTNGIVTMTLEADASLSQGLLDILGLDDTGWLNAGIYSGDRPVNFAVHDAIYIHLDQVNTSSNIVDGAPNTLIGIVPVTRKAFGEATSVYFANPEFRQLQSGAVNELKVSITDKYKTIINNHTLPITVVLEIK